MSTSVKDAIAQGNAAFCSNFNDGDIAAAANVYTANAQILPPGSPPVDGIDAIRAFWQGAAAMLGITDVRLATVELEELGASAVEVGRFALAGQSGTLDEGKYIVFWKRDEQGAWKWHRDIWNSSKS